MAKRCWECKGTGQAHPGGGLSYTCDLCQGKGHVPDSMVKCTNCKGKGQLWPMSTQDKQKQHWLAYDCSECRGRGIKFRRHKLSIWEKIQRIFK